VPSGGRRNINDLEDNFCHLSITDGSSKQQQAQLKGFAVDEGLKFKLENLVKSKSKRSH